MKRKMILLALATIMMAAGAGETEACTGITLKAGDGGTVVARTIEWAGSDIESRYVIVPRGYAQQSYVPGGKKGGTTFDAHYGYVGLAVQQDEFVTEGINEKGLSAGLFYFPRYGEYESYNDSLSTTTLSDLQLVSYVLGSCETVSDVKEALSKVHVVGVDPRASTAHWRFTDASGKQIVLEIIKGKSVFYDNPLGVITNSPSLDWQLANLNNYVNLFPGSAKPKAFGSLTLAPFGAGSGMLGLPGDVTPPSRFVRAAFYQTTAPQLATAEKTVVQCFHILNNFDIPVGLEMAPGEHQADNSSAIIPSATQWTSATDIANRRIYYRTMYNGNIRCIDLNTINFSKVRYQSKPLDTVKEQPVEMLGGW